MEGVRASAPVVYFGTVKKTELLERTKFDLKMRATVGVEIVFRTKAAPFSQARLDYSSYDEKIPALDGGPQYVLHSGDQVLVFANSDTGNAVPGYVLKGSCGEIEPIIAQLQKSLQTMDAKQLEVQEVTPEIRDSQLKLYDQILAFLHKNSVCSAE